MASGTTHIYSYYFTPSSPPRMSFFEKLHRHGTPVLFTVVVVMVFGLVPYFRERPGAFTAVLCSGMIAVRLGIDAVRSYREYMALGPGGIPHNVFGWMIQGLMQPIARRDVKSSAPFADTSITAKYGPHGRTSFLGPTPLPARNGDRPIVPAFVVPQRQTTEPASHDVVFRMQDFLQKTVDANSSVLQLKPSALEGIGTQAIWLAPHITPPTYMNRLSGEVCHVHSEAEGSSHMTLSLTDAELATSKGWAERHMMSGVFGLFPLTYVMVYAPRSEDEFEIWEKMVTASVKFVCAGVADVKNIV